MDDRPAREDEQDEGEEMDVLEEDDMALLDPQPLDMVLAEEALQEDEGACQGSARPVGEEEYVVVYCQGGTWHCLWCGVLF